MNLHWSRLFEGGRGRGLSGFAVGIVFLAVLFVVASRYVHRDAAIPVVVQVGIVVGLVVIVLSTYDMEPETSVKLVVGSVIVSATLFVVLLATIQRLEQPTESTAVSGVLTVASGVWLTTAATVYGWAVHLLARRTGRPRDGAE